MTGSPWRRRLGRQDLPSPRGPTFAGLDPTFAGRAASGVAARRGDADVCPRFSDPLCGMAWRPCVWPGCLQDSEAPRLP